MSYKSAFQPTDEGSSEQQLPPTRPGVGWAASLIKDGPELNILCVCVYVGGGGVNGVLLKRCYGLTWRSAPLLFGVVTHSGHRSQLRQTTSFRSHSSDRAAREEDVAHLLSQCRSVSLSCEIITGEQGGLCSGAPAMQKSHKQVTMTAALDSTCARAEGAEGQNQQWIFISRSACPHPSRNV